MTINCLNLDGTGEPCGECHSCRAIRNHSHWDVIEVDGARFRGIDDIKELTFRAYLAPFNANKKIYIIDEVHALTNDAFNCLLRLIEEPPPHLVVILCTTYPVSVEMLKRGKVAEEHPFQDSCYVIMEDGETGIRWVKRVY